MTDTDTISKTDVRSDIKEPSLYNVIYLNDNGTTFEFVISSLVQFFSYDLEKANDTAMEVHTAGSAIVATLPFELAEQKSHEVTRTARLNGYPLQVRIEEND